MRRSITVATFLNLAILLSGCPLLLCVVGPSNRAYQALAETRTAALKANVPKSVPWTMYSFSALAICSTAEGNPRNCPLLHTSVQAHISGYAARVEVEQVFQNPSAKTIDAVYTFPLSDSAAVDEMKMQIGGRVIDGSIQKKAEAIKTYTKAKTEGRTTTLLEQNTTNMFSQSVANIPPHSKVKVLLTYSELLSFQSGSYSFVYPMVVGQFDPTGPESHLPLNRAKGAKGAKPALPERRHGQDISLDVDINAGMPIGEISSKLHKVDILRANEATALVTMTNEHQIPNKDFVLSWRVGKNVIQSGYLTNRKNDGFFCLMLMPPAKPTASQICPREINFIIDRSGSQFGRPLKKAKETVLYTLNHLNPGDTFQIFSFSVATEQLFKGPQPVVPTTVAEAKKYINAMEADGGTELRRAVEIATSKPAPRNRLRIITVMTDGLVGNENEIIELVRRTRGTSRWFPFGTGDSVNRAIIDGIASAGGGEPDYVFLDGPGDVAGKQFLEKIANPVLTDVKVDIKGIEVADVEPKIINDVWAERPIYLTGRYLKPGIGKVVISGFSGGRKYKEEMLLEFPAENSRNTALPSLWARARVEDLSHTYHGKAGTKEGAEAGKSIEALGLKYHLLTDFTSFVAVDRSKKRIVSSIPAETILRKDSKSTMEGLGPVGNMGGYHGEGIIGRDNYYMKTPSTETSTYEFGQGGSRVPAEENASKSDVADVRGKMIGYLAGHSLDGPHTSGTVTFEEFQLDKQHGNEALADGETEAKAKAPNPNSYSAMVGAAMGGATVHSTADKVNANPLALQTPNSEIVQKADAESSANETLQQAQGPTRRRIQRIQSPKKPTNEGPPTICQNITMEAGCPVPQDVTIISNLDLVENATNDSSVSADSKLDKSVLLRLASIKHGPRKINTLRLKILISADNAKLVLLLKAMHVEVLKSSAQEIIVIAPVSKLREIALLDAVKKIELAK